MPFLIYSVNVSFILFVWEVITVNNKVYQIVKEQVLQMLKESEEQGTFHWVQPWSNACPFAKPYLSAPDKFYSGINLLLCPAGEYVSFRQIQEMQEKDESIHLRKGSKAKTIYYFNFQDKKDEKGNVELDKDGKPIKIPFFKFYKVFSINDVNNLETRMPIDAVEHTTDENIDKALMYAKRYCDISGIDYVEKKGSNQAYFVPSANAITVPDRSQFQSMYEFLSTIFHEISHAIDYKLGLTNSIPELKTSRYASGELLAEWGACIFLNMFHIEDDSTTRNSAEYLRGWSDKIKSEKDSYIVTMANKAWKAANHLKDTVELSLLQEQANEQDEVVILAENKIIHIQVNEDGDFDYSIYSHSVDSDRLRLFDGGVLDKGEEIKNIYDAMADILEGFCIDEKNISLMDIDDFESLMAGDLKLSEDFER